MQPGTGTRGAQAAGTGDDEAPKDPGARITHQSYTEKDYEGKRAFPEFFFFSQKFERKLYNDRVPALSLLVYIYIYYAREL